VLQHSVDRPARLADLALSGIEQVHHSAIRCMGGAVGLCRVQRELWVGQVAVQILKMITEKQHDGMGCSSSAARALNKVILSMRWHGIIVISNKPHSETALGCTMRGAGRGRVTCSTCFKHGMRVPVPITSLQ
jgi:hypothetical protein